MSTLAISQTFIKRCAAGFTKLSLPNLAMPMLLLVGLLLATTPASAAGFHQMEPLPDLGHGSRANGLIPGLGSSRGDVVGEITLPNGLSVPAHWRYDPAADSTRLTELPIPAGHQGSASGIASDLNGKVIVVGTLVDSNGVAQAAYWREGEPEASGTPTWSASQPLPDAGNGSRVNGLTPGLGTSRGDVVGEMTLPDGTTVPTRWQIDFHTGGVAQEQLPLLPNSTGTANGLTPDLDSSRGDVVGEMTLPSGSTLPVHWRYDSATDSTLVTELPLPAGFQGTASGIASDANGKTIVVGILISGDGNDFAAFWREGEPAANGAPTWSASHLLPDAGNGSRANGLNPGLDSSRGDVVGEMTLANGLTVPVMWSIDLNTDGVTQQQLPTLLNSGGTANGLTPTLGSSRGDVVGTSTNGSQPQAVRWLFNDGN